MSGACASSSTEVEAPLNPGASEASELIDIAPLPEQGQRLTHHGSS